MSDAPANGKPQQIMAKRVPPLTMARIKDRIRAVESGKARPRSRLFSGDALVVEIRPDALGFYPYSLARVPVPVAEGQPKKRREMGLGAVDMGTEFCSQRKAQPLAVRRKEALAALEAVVNGVDPIEARRRNNLLRQVVTLESLQAAKTTPTFGEAVARYVVKEKGGWSSERYADGWAKAIKDHVGPLWDMPVNLIERQHVRDGLKAVWVKHPVTAHKVRARGEVVMNYATAEGWRSGDNPATLKAIKDLMPAVLKASKNVEHMGAIPWRRIGDMMVALESSDAIGAAAARFTILTCARAEEVRSLTWGEIDMRPAHTVTHEGDDGQQYPTVEGAAWTLPKARSKSRRDDHVVPLSNESLAILKTQHDLFPSAGPRDAVFPGRGGRGHLDIGGMRYALAASGFKRVEIKVNGRVKTVELTMHGCARATFRDWVGEVAKHDPVLAELALQHVVGDATMRAYARSTLLDRRRALMGDWGRFCTRPLKQAAAGNVVSLRAGAG